MWVNIISIINVEIESFYTAYSNYEFEFDVVVLLDARSLSGNNKQKENFFSDKKRSSI